MREWSILFHLILGLAALLSPTVASAECLDAGALDAGPCADAAAFDERALADAGIDLQELQNALQQDAPANATGGRSTPPATVPSASTGMVSTLQSMNPDISFILDVAGAWFSREPSLQTGGHDPRVTGFNLQQLELAIGKTVDPYLRFDADIVFGAEGLEIEEAYATTLDLPFRLQARAGEFFTRFGRQNSRHPHAWDFVDQPIVLGRVFGADGNHGLGAELSWLAPLPWYVEVMGSATNATGEETARSFYGASEVPIKSPLDLQFTGAIKQFFDPTDDVSLLWGVSAAAGPNRFGGRARTAIYGTDVYLKYRPLTGEGFSAVALQAEGLLRQRDTSGGRLTDFGMYAQLLWQFDRRWATAVRYELGTPAIAADGEPAFDPLDPEWTRTRERYTANVTFWPTEFSRLRLQGSADVPRWETTVRYAAMLAFEVSVGAHGAHAF